MSASYWAAGARKTRSGCRTRHAQQTEDARPRATCRVDKGRPLNVEFSSSVSRPLQAEAVASKGRPHSSRGGAAGSGGRWDRSWQVVTVLGC